MIRAILPTLFCLAVASAGGTAQPDKDVEKLLASMRTAYSSVNSATMEIATRLEIEGKAESQLVRMDYQKPNLLRLAFKFRGQTITRISDGKKVYLVGEKGDPYVINFSIEAMGNDSPVNLEALSFFDWKRQLSTSPGSNMEKSKFKIIESERWNDKTWIVLEETALGQNVFVRYFIDPKTYFIWRCDVRTLEKKEFIMETELRTLVLNPKLDPKIFSAPKKG